MRDQLKERTQKRINKIVNSLEAEGRKFGWIRDRRGLRYIPTELFLRMEDYTAGVEYINWFQRNFPRDKGLPEFWLELTIIYFKAGKIKEAEKMAFQAWRSNNYIFAKYFGTEILPVEKFEKSESEAPDYVKTVHFKAGNPRFADFDQWLQQIITSKKFHALTDKFIIIRQELLHENDPQQRNELNKQERELFSEI